jgi:hypothetical protein
MVRCGLDSNPQRKLGTEEKAGARALEHLPARKVVPQAALRRGLRISPT